jgi:hypothetical protein
MMPVEIDAVDADDDETPMDPWDEPPGGYAEEDE